MTQRFDDKARERDALYQATVPVYGTALAFKLFCDRKAARYQRQADEYRATRDRTEVLPVDTLPNP
jgi:hypothetical protein